MGSKVAPNKSAPATSHYQSRVWAPTRERLARAADERVQEGAAVERVLSLAERLDVIYRTV
jgi:hypothetical protein